MMVIVLSLIYAYTEVLLSKYGSSTKNKYLICLHNNFYISWNIFTKFLGWKEGQLKKGEEEITPASFWALNFEINPNHNLNEI